MVNQHDKTIVCIAYGGATIHTRYAITDSKTLKKVDDLYIYMNNYEHDGNPISKEEYNAKVSYYGVDTWINLKYTSFS